MNCVHIRRFYSLVSHFHQSQRILPSRYPFCWIINNLIIEKSVPDICYLQARHIRKKGGKDISTLIVPVPVKASNNPDDISIGEELSTKLDKVHLIDVLTNFYKRPTVKKLSEENGLLDAMYNQVFLSFKKHCTESETLPVDLHIALSDILQGAGHVDDLFPYFLRHARQMYPHLECMDDLKKISDLRLPANWYPEARAIKRKIIYHAGPTNSGKTHHALERFISAKSGVYCGPLKMLAVEVHAKTNEKGTPCDLVTGEEKQYANPDGTASNHVACTVEMTSVTMQCDVAIIDEIQMVRDPGRGWAWTRALLGVPAKEIHLCGEAAAINIVKEIISPTGEEIEVRNYERLTKLHVEDKALVHLDNIQPGDCIVCFSKNDIFSVSLQLEQHGYECAVIYGSLPPGTKLAQANKFNDPNHPCKILVATDAIGMGLNLSIRRIIFYSLVKPNQNEHGEREMDIIPTHQALQIAGRAGRYGTQFSEGYVTTFKRDDLPILREILSRSVEPITAAGLHPTADQIELFAYHLPNSTLSNLIDIFVNLCEVDTSAYFMCNVEDFKFLADMIQHVPLPLRARYVFCCAPINKKATYVCTMFLKFARQYSRNESMTFDWLCRVTGWPFRTPKTIAELVHLEAVFDVLDLYLWLSYRFQDLFLEVELVRDMQKELDQIIQQGVFNITHLLKMSQSGQPLLSSKDLGSASDSEEGADETQWKIGKSIFKSSHSATPSKKQPVTPHIDPGKGRLTDYLVNQGLLTAAMIKKLQDEWKNSDTDATDVPKPAKDEKPRLKPIKPWKKKPTK